MKEAQERVLAVVNDALERTASRRNILRGSAGVAGGLALASVVGLRAVGAQDATPEADGTAAAAADSPFDSEVDVLNYALTLEHIESTFYREGLEQFATADFEAAGFQAGVREYITAIGEHEAAHVETLTSVITDLGGEPVEELTYDFGYDDLAGFLTTAGALENTGVSAYTGAAQYLIENDDLLTAALTIHGVEARHAAYLNVINGESPFPEAVDPPLTPDEVLAIAGPFIVEEGASPDATPAG